MRTKKQVAVAVPVERLVLVRDRGEALVLEPPRDLLPLRVVVVAAGVLTGELAANGGQPAGSGLGVSPLDLRVIDRLDRQVDARSGSRCPVQVCEDVPPLFGGTCSMASTHMTA